MTLAEALRARLGDDAGVQQLAAGRIYPLRLPAQAAFPAVTYQLISSPRQQTQDGGQLVNPRYRAICWAKTYLEAEQLGEAVAAALQGWRSDQVRVLSASVDDENEDDEPDTGLYRRDVEVLLWRQR